MLQIKNASEFWRHFLFNSLKIKLLTTIANEKCPILKSKKWFATIAKFGL